MAKIIYRKYVLNIVYFFCLPYTYIRKELRIIYIELNDPNPFKDLLHKIFDKLEDLMFSIIQKLPEKFIPHSLMNWMERYTDKRLAELKQQIIRDQWKKIALEKAVENIHKQNN